MPLLGQAAIAMWWDMAPAHRDEFEHWHSHEHFPERLGIPGFRRGSRWADATGGPGFFVMYELDDYATLSSPHYLERLNNPTPWSRKLMPRHSNMVRSLTRVLGSFGGGLGQSMLTLRLSPAAGQGEALRASLCATLAALPLRPGLASAHLLQTQAPAIAPTQEQLIRGGVDPAADWIVLVNAYDAAAIALLLSGELCARALADAGAAGAPVSAIYDLRLAMTPSDLLPMP
ncbi:hypothetical protein [Caenimonas koreensis]|uniref:hypothetical protein n=1 Tax=Caenimonas koreensis TaxID=367474 RepID=UPI00378408A3